MKREIFSITDIAEAIVQTAPQNAKKPFPYLRHASLYSFEDCVRGLRASIVTLADRARERAGVYWTQEYRRKAGNSANLDREHMGGVFDQAVYEIEHDIKIARTFRDRGVTTEHLRLAEQSLLDPVKRITTSENQNSPTLATYAPYRALEGSLPSTEHPDDDDSILLMMLP